MTVVEGIVSVDGMAYSFGGVPVVDIKGTFWPDSVGIIKVLVDAGAFHEWIEVAGLPHKALVGCGGVIGARPELLNGILHWQEARRSFSRTSWKTGNRTAASVAIIAITILAAR